MPHTDHLVSYFLLKCSFPELYGLSFSSEIFFCIISLKTFLFLVPFFEFFPRRKVILFQIFFFFGLPLISSLWQLESFGIFPPRSKGYYLSGDYHFSCLLFLIFVLACDISHLYFYLSFHIVFELLLFKNVF